MTTMTATASSWVYGQPVTFTATVTVFGPGSGPASGVVVFMDGDVALGTATLDAAGTAIFTTAAMNVGDHSVAAFYRGSVTQVLLPSDSDTIQHQVNPATPINLTIDSFSLADSGQLSVQYTVTAGSLPFNIGIYSSPDGVQPGDLLQTFNVSDSDLTVAHPHCHIPRRRSCPWRRRQLPGRDAGRR